ncbi:MAG: AAA domain-containing protein [Verrucomicrobiales bacterium]|nr:AAA domain-containing protein [Verrucomicrobiales bacterium]
MPDERPECGDVDDDSAIEDLENDPLEESIEEDLKSFLYTGDDHDDLKLTSGGPDHGPLSSFYNEFNLEDEDALPTDGLSNSERSEVADRLEEIEILAPTDIEQALLEHGYRGQGYARRAGAVLAYRHMQRLRRDFLENLPADDLPTRENYLFLGATGAGKTYLTEMLFRDILGVPTVVADVTRCSETGYIGDDVQMLLSELYESAGQHRGWASCGVVCLDEFDKLAASRSSARFAGEGTTKDVSGFGVQRGLLTMLSGKSSPFPTDFGFSGMGQRVTMPLRNIMFIACGAFSGLKETAELIRGRAEIGFTAKIKPDTDDSIVSRIGAELLENTKAFSNYGILPELLGRFSRLVPFQPLEADVLRQILEDILIESYRKEFKNEGVELVIREEVLEHVVGAARTRETGARGLRASLVPHLEEAAFQTFGHKTGGRVILQIENGEVELTVEGAA